MTAAIPFCEKHQEQKRYSHQNYKCRSCQREYQRANGQAAKGMAAARKRRADWMAANGPCRHCGSWEELELDHIDPSTKNPVLRSPSNAIWRWGDEKRNEELAKCQPLCASCHLKKTVDERGGPAKHGTCARYVRQKCRCAECRQAVREYANRHYHANRDHYRAQLRVAYWKRKLKVQENVQLPEDLAHLRSHTDLEQSESYGR